MNIANRNAVSSQSLFVKAAGAVELCYWRATFPQNFAHAKTLDGTDQMSEYRTLTFLPLLLAIPYQHRPYVQSYVLL